MKELTFPIKVKNKQEWDQLAKQLNELGFKWHEKLLTDWSPFDMITNRGTLRKASIWIMLSSYDPKIIKWDDYNPHLYGN